MTMRAASATLPSPSVARDLRGAVYVEFLLVFLPVFLLFLCILELGFLYTGRLVAQHAATRAARAAVVILDDDPAFYGGEARNRVDANGTTTGVSAVEAFLVGSGYGSGASAPRGAARFRDIRSAASIPLLAVAPSAAQLGDDDSVRNAIGLGPQRAMTGAQQYNEAALAVTFPTAPGANSFRTTFTDDEVITVRVTYLMHCSVPLVPVLMCDEPSGLDLAAEESSQMDLGYLAGIANPRFQVVRAETTLRNQWASYLYPSESPP
jgi:Flp pilus assembly protein TadG